MKKLTNNCKEILIVLLSVFVLSCKKESSPYVSSSAESNPHNYSESLSDVKTKYVKNCTLEVYTTLWCGWCPRAKTLTDQALTAYPNNVVPMEFHGGGGSGLEDDNALSFDGVRTLMSAFSVPGYPTSYLNRKLNYTGKISEIAPLITVSSTSNVSSPVGIAINSSLNGSKLSITARARFAQAMSGSKLVVYVLEDGIVTAHANYYNDGKGNPILNYVNDHVVRNSASSVLGDLIPAQTLGSEYSKTYTVSIPTSWNKQRLSIAAIVVQSNNSVLNARKAVVGQSQDFQLIQ